MVTFENINTHNPRGIPRAACRSWPNQCVRPLSRSWSRASRSATVPAAALAPSGARPPAPAGVPRPPGFPATALPLRPAFPGRSPALPPVAARPDCERIPVRALSRCGHGIGRGAALAGFPSLAQPRGQVLPPLPAIPIRSAGIGQTLRRPLLRQRPGRSTARPIQSRT